MGEFWLSDEQWARLEPLLPNKPRGVPRVDDRRVISGIVHVLQSGCRWKDAPERYGPAKTLYNRHVRWGAKGVWREVFETLGGDGRTACGGPDRQHPCEGAPLGCGRQRGASAQAIGSSRGGRKTKLHALADRQGRPLAFHLTPGQAADCKAAEALLIGLPERCIVLADRAYDTVPVRQLIEGQGAAPNIPSKVTRRWKSCFSPVLYKGRNAIERMFCRLKDFRRLATRYDKLATNFLASIHLAAALTWWL